ncbi:MULTISPECIES: hypothetical protein [unclassified Afipia]|uniref:hypothetical protein n=1 Tax=unclassified Afipia TaxID=2642050 RepID=UPI000464E688|nr:MULTISPECIES: hypothetical protein [unclassified Afipia]
MTGMRDHVSTEHQLARCEQAMFAQNHRQIDGKIKEMPPRRSQATDVAGLPAGASVGARAARRERANKNNAVFGTIGGFPGSMATTMRVSRRMP